MPTYQYACTSCGHQLEAVQSFHDAPLTECTACTGALRKVFSSVGVVFKGPGFYRTDSRSGGTIGAAPSDSKPKEQGTKSTSESTSKPTESSNSSSGTKSTAQASA